MARELWSVALLEWGSVCLTRSKRKEVSSLRMDSRGNLPLVFNAGSVESFIEYHETPAPKRGFSFFLIGTSKDVKEFRPGNTEALQFKINKRGHCEASEKLAIRKRAAAARVRNPRVFRIASSFFIWASPRRRFSTWPLPVVFSFLGYVEVLDMNNNYAEEVYICCV